jgi:hypothetical protein
VSKAYKGGLCAYCCQAEATTADHVIARGFFPDELRGNLPKVGACSECNNKKSKLEHSLTAVMPFGARHGRATEALLAIEGKLAKNQKLFRWLAEGVRYTLRSINGSPWQVEMTVPVSSHDIEALGEYIVKGLARHHWKLDIGPDIFVRSSFLKAQGAAAFDRFFEGKARERLSFNLGEGVFGYEAIQSVDDPEVTLWKMTFYGAEVGGDPSAAGERASLLYGVTVAKSSKAASLLASILGER